MSGRRGRGSLDELSESLLHNDFGPSLRASQGGEGDGDNGVSSEWKAVEEDGVPTGTTDVLSESAVSSSLSSSDPVELQHTGQFSQGRDNVGVGGGSWLAKLSGRMRRRQRHPAWKSREHVVAGKV